MQNGSDAANAQDRQWLENIRTLIIATRKIEDTNAAINLYDLIAGSKGFSLHTLKALIIMDMRMSR